MDPMGSMLFCRRLFLFHPNSPVALQDSTFILQPAVRIIRFRRCPHLTSVSLDGSRETYCGLLVVSRCAFPGGLEERESEETLWNTTILKECFGLPLRNTLWSILCLSAANRGISSMDCSIYTIMERYDASGKKECPGKAYLAETIRE
jgi:hypothetical protein